MSKMNKIIYVVAIVCGILNFIISLYNHRGGEALAWITSVIWAGSSFIYEKKYHKEKSKSDVIEELVEKTPNNEELGKYIKELHD